MEMWDTAQVHLDGFSEFLIMFSFTWFEEAEYIGGTGSVLLPQIPQSRDLLHQDP